MSETYIALKMPSLETEGDWIDTESWVVERYCETGKTSRDLSILKTITPYRKIIAQIDEPMMMLLSIIELIDRVINPVESDTFLYEEYRSLFLVLSLRDRGTQMSWKILSMRKERYEKSGIDQILKGPVKLSADFLNKL
jgi:hypothetical protein